MCGGPSCGTGALYGSGPPSLPFLRKLGAVQLKPISSRRWTRSSDSWFFSFFWRKVYWQLCQGERETIRAVVAHAKQEKTPSCGNVPLLHDPASKLTILRPCLGHIAVAVSATIVQQFLEAVLPTNCWCRHFPIESQSFQLINAELGKRRAGLGSTGRELSTGLELRLAIIFCESSLKTMGEKQCFKLF